MLAIPTVSDTPHNTRLVERHLVGKRLHKDAFWHADLLYESVHDVLFNATYQINANRLKEMILARPPPSDRIVKNFEFLARFGPLRILDHRAAASEFAIE